MNCTKYDKYSLKNQIKKEIEIKNDMKIILHIRRLQLSC